ncbi:hypothetical protein niasHS_003214 [Heterodera schachtii]|uniref:Uncharacterized protein n=1 Tax=Heterodera schachtii TaxID=97005 RepID=A0ABD2KFU7_HETSC
MPPNLLFLLMTMLTSLLHQQLLANKFSAEIDSTNPARLIQRRHLIRSRAIHKEKMRSNVNEGYLQWEKDKFHEALGEKILPKSSRSLMDPKFLGSVEPRLLKTSADGRRTKSDSEEEKWRNWLRRHFPAARAISDQ